MPLSVWVASVAVAGIAPAAFAQGSPVTPTITWATPAAINYSRALSSTQLDAKANVPGTYAYAPAAGTVLDAGTQTLSVTFTPNDTVDYTTATASVSLTVNPIVAPINWPTPAAIMYPTPLSVTQLDASTTVAGSFSYSIPAGRVLTPGSYTVGATFNPTDANYKSSITRVTVTVIPASPQITPTIRWATPSAINYSTALGAYQLSAAASVPGTLAYSPAAGTVLHAGTQTLSVTFTPNDTVDYTTAKASVNLTVNPIAAPVSWPTPAPIAYPTPLSATQLDATTTVAGSFSYSIPAGRILKAGTYTVGATFTPTDPNYKSSVTRVQVTVTPAATPITPTITWATPAAINYTRALGTAQLNATASVPGTFSYSPASGTVLGAGVQTLSVSFTPADSLDYTTAAASVSLTVNQIVAPIAWPAPAAIMFPTPLGATQLDASTTVAGSFSYSIPAGRVLTPGSYTVGATFNPTDANYKSSITRVTVTVIPASPQIVPGITWATPGAISYGTALSTSQLNATASVPGKLNYTPAAGTMLSAGAQTLSVNFTPTDTVDYATATASVPLTVNQQAPTVTWAAPAAITYGRALGASQLDATASVPGTFAYAPAAGTVLSAGSQTLSVTFTPTDSVDYATATASVPLTVNQATTTVTWGAPAAITYGTALGAQQLDATASVPGMFAYAPAAGTVLSAGSQTLSVTFTPTDSVDYATATGSVALAVNQATPTLTWLPPASVTSGTPLSLAQLDANASVPGTYDYVPAAGTVLSVGTQTLNVTFTPADTVDYTSATASQSLTVYSPGTIISHTIQITSDADDGYYSNYDNSGWHMDPQVDGADRVGSWGGQTLAWVSGYRFPATGINSGDTIQSAYLELVNSNGGATSDTCGSAPCPDNMYTYSVYGVAQDDGPPFNGDSGNTPLDVPYTNAYNPYTTTGPGDDTGSCQGNNNGQNTCTHVIDVTNIVQEITSRPGWTNASAMRFVLLSTDPTGPNAYAGYVDSSANAAEAATLVVNPPQPTIVSSGAWGTSASETYPNSYQVGPYVYAGASTLLLFLGDYYNFDGLVVDQPSVTDSCGNTWNILAGPTNWVGYFYFMRSTVYYVQSPAPCAGGDTITVTTDNQEPIFLHFLAVAGSDPTQTPVTSAITSPSPAMYTTSAQSNAITMPGPGLLVSWIFGDSDAPHVYTPQTGFIKDLNSTPNYLTAASENVSTGGPYQTQFSITPSDGWQVVIIGLVPPSQGP